VWEALVVPGAVDALRRLTGSSPAGAGVEERLRRLYTGLGGLGELARLLRLLMPGRCSLVVEGEELERLAHCIREPGGDCSPFIDAVCVAAKPVYILDAPSNVRSIEFSLEEGASSPTLLVVVEAAEDTEAQITRTSPEEPVTPPFSISRPALLTLPGPGRYRLVLGVGAVGVRVEALHIWLLKDLKLPAARLAKLLEKNRGQPRQRRVKRLRRRVR